MQTLLAAVDGSDHADRALRIAIDLALRHQARLIIVHVVQPGALLSEERMAPDGARPLPMWMREAMVAGEHAAEDSRTAHRNGEMILDRALSQARRAGCADVETRCESGDPVDAIVACAELAGADAVVLGSRGLGRPGAAMLGGVSRGIADGLACTRIIVQ